MSRPKIRIVYTPLFDEIYGTTAYWPKEPDFFLIAINSQMAPIQQRRTLGHELAHVFLGHLTDEKMTLGRAEREAWREAWEYYRAYRDGALDGQFTVRSLPA